MGEHQWMRVFKTFWRNKRQRKQTEKATISEDIPAQEGARQNPKEAMNSKVKNMAQTGDYMETGAMNCYPITFLQIGLNKRVFFKERKWIYFSSFYFCSLLILELSLFIAAKYSDDFPELNFS